MLVLAFHLLALGQLGTCPSCGACHLSGHLSGSSIILDGYAGEYYFLTRYSAYCSACSSVGGDMYIYQAYDGTGLFAKRLNKYLWFDCTIGMWTRSVVPEFPTGPCRDPFSCAGPYPSESSEKIMAFGWWSSCPYSGAPKCPAPPSHLPFERKGGIDQGYFLVFYLLLMNGWWRLSIIGGALLLLFPPFFVWVFYLLFMIGWWSSRGWEWSLPIIGVLLLLRFRGWGGM